MRTLLCIVLLAFAPYVGAAEPEPEEAAPDGEISYELSADRLEYQFQEEGGILLWDIEARAGRGKNSLIVETEGERSVEDDVFEEIEVELLYGRLIASGWEVQLGVQHDFEPDPERSFAVFGVEGEVPYGVEVEISASFSDDGDGFGSLEIEHDLALARNLILYSRFETGLALQEVEEYETGQGISDITLGVRLGYALSSVFAPYVGFTWTRALGETADLVEDAGGDEESSAVVAGFKIEL